MASQETLYVSSAWHKTARGTTLYGIHPLGWGSFTQGLKALFQHYAVEMCLFCPPHLCQHESHHVKHQEEQHFEL